MEGDTMSNNKSVHISDEANEKIRLRAKAAGIPANKFIERLAQRGVILDEAPDGSFQDRLLSELALRYDPTVSDSIRSYAEFRGVTPLELVFRHIYYGVNDGTFFE